MTKQELKAKIDKLENGIKSKATPSNLIAPLKAQKAKFEKELEDMESAEKKAVKTKKVSKVAEKIKAAKTSVAKKTPAKAPAKEERKKDNIARDGDRKSLPSGKRISKSGKVYYETRANRSDKQTSKKPYLADGGETHGWKKTRTRKLKTREEAEKAIGKFSELMGRAGRNYKVEKMDDGYIISYESNYEPKMADGGKLPNGKYKYEKGDEGMFQGDEVRVVKYHNGDRTYEYNIIDEDGQVKTHGVAKAEKFENQFRYFPKMEVGGEIDWGADLGGGFSIGNDVVITERNSEYKGKEGVIIGKEGDKLIVDITSMTPTWLDAKTLISMDGVERLDAPEYAKGGIVVTSIKDIPNFEERLEQGRITYRGLGMGKLANDFYDIAGTGGTRIKVDGKEYFITDEEFNTFNRGADGRMRVRFDAPARRGYADGGEIEETKEFKKQMIKNNKETIEYLKNKLERAQKIGQSENDIKTIKENIDFHTQIVREYEKELNELKNKDMNYAKGGDVKKHKVVTSKESYANDLLKYADLQNIPASSKMLGNKFIVTFDAIPKAMDSMTQDVKNLVNKMDKGGYMAEGGELNLLVRKMASQKGLTPKKLGSDYELVMAQAVVDAFTDANYHDAARKLVSILEKKPEIAVKPDYPSPSDPEFKVKFDAINEKYDSKYWHGDEKTRDFAVKVSQNSGWDGNGIAGAFEYLLRMEGYHRLADNIKKSIELSDAEKIADFAYENDIYATGNSFEDFSRRIKEKSGTNYSDEDLQIAYNLLSNVRYEKGGYMADGGQVKVGDILTANTGVKVKVVEYDPKFGGRVRVERIDEYATGKPSVFMPLSRFKMADGGEVEKLAEYLVTLTDEDGFEDDVIVMAKNEDDAVYKAEQIRGYESTENGVVMLTDFDGNKIEYKKGGYMADGGEVDKELIDASAKSIYDKRGMMSLRNTFLQVAKADEDAGDKETAEYRRRLVAEYQSKQPKMMANGGQVPAHFGSGKNIEVFGYETKNFDICATAVKEFEAAVDIMKDSKELEKESLAYCAKYVDNLFGIEKVVVEGGIGGELNFSHAVSDIMSASTYNFRAGMAINLYSFVPQHLMEIALRLAKAEKGGFYALGGMTAGRWYKDKSGEEFKFIGKVDSGANKGRFLFSDGQKSLYKELEDFEGGKPKETKLFGFFEEGGMLIHGFQQGDTILEIYKGYGIVENKNNGVIEVLNPNRGTRFIIDLDESKPTGRKSMGMSKDEQMESAKRYIDYLDKPLPDTLLEKFRAEGKMEKGGYMADGGMMDVVNAEISTIKRNIMGTTSFVMKIKGMRNPQDFIVYPISADQAGQPIMIQSDTRIGFLDLSSGRGLMSQSHANGAYRHHFTMDKKVPFKISETDLQRLKEHISGTAGSSVGNMGISSDNSGASMMAKGGGVEKFNKGDKFYDTQEQRLVEIKNVRKDGVIEFHSITEDNDFFFTEPLIKKVLNSGVWFKISDELGMASKVEKFNEGDKFYDTQEQRLVEIKNVRKDGVIEFHSITEDNDFYLSNSLLKKGLNSGVWFKILDELGMGLKAKGGYMAKGGMTRKGGQSFEVNSRKFFYHKDDGNVYDSNHRLYAGSYETLEQAKKSLEKNFEDIKKGTFFKDGGMMAKGGEVKVGDVYERKGFGKLKITKIDDGEVYFKYDNNDKEFSEGMYGAEGKIANKQWVKVDGKMAMGGKVKFADKVKSVQESLLKRKKVAPKVQKDYGKTYSKAEAKESAQRIVGSRMAQLKEKMAKKKK